MEIKKQISTQIFLVGGFVIGLVFFFNSGSLFGYGMGVAYSVLLAFLLSKSFFGKGKLNYLILFVLLFIGAFLFISSLNGTKQKTYERNIFTDQCKIFAGSAYTVWYYEEDPTCWCEITGAEFSSFIDKDKIETNEEPRVRCDELGEYLSGQKQ